VDLDRPNRAGFWQLPGTRLSLAILLVGLALAIPNRYALTIFHEANSAGRVYAVQSFVHYDSWSFENILCRTGPHHGLIDLSVREGKPLLQKAPGMSWLGVPVYALATLFYGEKLPFHQAATLLGLLCSWLPGLVLLFIIGRWWMHIYGANVGLLAVLALLAASPLWTYLPMYMDYALATLLLPAAWLAWRSERAVAFVLGGLLAGLAATVNYMFLIYGGALFLLSWGARWRGGKHPWAFAGLAVLGGLGPVLALLCYHTLVWGHPLATAYDFMAHDVHKAMHDAAGFSLPALVDSLVHPKLGLLFTVPWITLGWVGLATSLRNSDRQLDAAAGLLLTLTVLLFVTSWRGANTDDLAFNRHAIPLLPWAALGLASGLKAVADWPLLPRKLLHWGLAGTLLVAFLYQFVTAWTYPYHHDAVDSPLWQVNLPLFVNGFLLPTVTLTPVMRETLDVLGGGLWWWVATSLVLTIAGLVLARIGAGQRHKVKHYAVLPATLAAVVAALLMWGVATDTAGPEEQRMAAEAVVRGSAGHEISQEERRVLQAVAKARRYYEMTSTDIHGSYFTPQDVLWNDRGYPETNSWCR
jgi:hypothetical protein